MMLVDTLIIPRAGRPPMRVRVFRIDRGRRARMARALAANGYAHWQIRQLLRLSADAFRRALAGNDLWGAHADALKRALGRGDGAP